MSSQFSDSIYAAILSNNNNKIVDSGFFILIPTYIKIDIVFDFFLFIRFYLFNYINKILNKVVHYYYFHQQRLKCYFFIKRITKFALGSISVFISPFLEKSTFELEGGLIFSEDIF